MERNWKNIQYLLQGKERQKKAYQTLKKLHIFELLKDYHSVLAGTLPIDIHIETSDLDILCEVYDFDGFEAVIEKNFGAFDHFKVTKSEKRGKQILVANFFFEGFEIEIYGEALPVEKQNGYRHMLVEDRILNFGGEEIKGEIIALKKAGLKTEPAFAKLLNLQGDPYDALLKIEEMDNKTLKTLVGANSVRP